MYILKREPDGGPPGLDTHAQIAIGVIIPVVVLLGGLILFIWYTERQRRNRIADDLPGSRHVPSRPKINSYLHRGSKAPPRIQTSRIDVDAIEIAHPRASDTNLHELEDTGKVEPQKMQNTPNRLNSNRLNQDDERKRTSSPRDINDRNDSAIEAAAARLESRDTDRSHEGPEREELDTTKMEPIVQTPPEARLHFNREYRSSLQPEYRLSLKPGLSKRDSRMSSSRYSKEVPDFEDVEARFSRDAAARYSANVEQLRDMHHASMPKGATTTLGRMSIQGATGFSHTSLHARDRDSNIPNTSEESLERAPLQHFNFSPTYNDRLSNATSNPNLSSSNGNGMLSSINYSCDSPTVSEISRSTNRNSALSTIPPDRSSQRWSGVPGEMPSWMKRLSVQDTVEGKWRNEGEIVPPENIRAGGAAGGAGMENGNLTGVAVTGTWSSS